MFESGFRGGAVSLDRRSAESQRVATNAPQVVTHYHRHITTGVGRARVDQPVVFDIPFLNEPTLTDGLAVISTEKSGDFYDPEGGATVRAWTTDANGHFTGALISVYVHCEPVNVAAEPSFDDDGYPTSPSEPVPAGVRCAHTLAFTGQAYKKLDDDVQTQLQASTPRLVGY